MIRAVFAILLGAVFAVAPAQADDAEDIQAAVDGVYNAISGPAGADRDWDAFRAMFLPRAIFTVAGKGEEGTGSATQISVEEYIERSGAYLVEIGFTESETRGEIRQYGELATVLSAYDGVRTDTGELVAKGVNTFILAKVAGEWKIASISWRAADDAWPVERMFD